MPIKHQQALTKRHIILGGISKSMKWFEFGFRENNLEVFWA